MELGRLSITLPVPFVPARACVDLAVRAERELGYHAVWLAETAGPDSFTLAGAIAGATERIAIGTAVVPVFTRTPAVLSMSAASLAELSNGRFVLGLGSSSHAIVEGWNGVPFERPLTRVRETVAIVRQALSGERTDFEGEVLRSRGLRLSPRPERPVPIYLAALREHMLELAGEIGDGLILNLFPPAALPRILDAWRRGARRAGSDPSGREVVCRLMVGVTDDPAAARGLVRLAFTGYFAQPVYNAYMRWCGYEEEAQALSEAFGRGDRAGSAAAMTDAFIDQIAILGSAGRCRERIAELVAGGVTTPVLSPLAASAREVAAMFEALAPARQP